jgi:hypothetical protein
LAIVGCRGGLAALQPQKSTWKLSLLDHYLTVAEQQHVDLIVPLALSPAWASARPREHSAYSPGNAAEPRNSDDRRDYVATVVDHCKGRVGYYEIRNEPNSKDFFSGSPEQLVSLAREAYRIIKE